MPILPAEPDRFPADLFDAPPAAGERAWWVLHTKPRQEKSLARHLQAASVGYYLPAVTRRTRIRGRVVSAHVPLFTSYLFLHADRDGRVAALASNRVVHSLPVPDQDRLWRDLRQVERLIATGAPLTPEARLAPGAEVEITSGPLAGLCGTVVRTTSGRRFVVRVDFIQQGASVTLDDYALVPLRPERAAAS
jgi:transcription antitermination factor NusG